MQMTEDQSALRQLMRLRGFSLMCNILEDFIEDAEVCTVVLEGISTWPLLQRNKIEDSKIEEPVRQLVQSDNDRLKELSEKLIAHWESLEVGYRIPKRLKNDRADDILDIAFYGEVVEESIQTKRKRLMQEEVDQLTKFYEEEQRRVREREDTPEEKPSTPATPLLLKSSLKYIPTVEVFQPKREDALSLIESLRSEAEKLQEATAEKDAEAAKKAAEKEKERHRKRHTQLSEAEKEALKEKKLQKLVGAVVVKCLSKHRDQMSHDEFKQHAKELTQLISDKEKKSQSYQSGKLDSLSDEKTVKIKKFAKEYISKLLRRIEKTKASGGTTPFASTSTGTPLSDSGSGTARSGSHTLVEVDTLDLDDTPEFDDGDVVGANGHGRVDRMSIDGDEQSASSTPATATPNPRKRTRWDQPPSVVEYAVRSPAKDPRARDHGKSSSWDSRRPSTSS